jgi:hypothetical protein
VSTASPLSGQVLTWNGSAWVPGAAATGGSGGGGQVYFFNAATPAQIPTASLPGTPFELGLTSEVSETFITSSILPSGGVYSLVAGFVTQLNAPSLDAIPAGLWDFNIWAQSTGITPNTVLYKLGVYAYDGVGSPTLVASSSALPIYDPTQLNQYTLSLTVPQTTILTSDRIYVEIEATSTSGSQQLIAGFGDGYPSHVHSTLPSVAGTGIVHVINGVFQSPASPIDLSAGLTEISGTLPVNRGGTGNNTAPATGSLLIGDGSGYTLSTLTAGTGVSITNGVGSITVNSSGITALSGDVTASGPGSSAATVAKIQGYDVSTTAPTANQILQWISGTSKWTPTANGVGLGSKIFLVVEGGAYATVQDAIDAASDWDVILVGPKAAGASWGPITFSPGKRLSVIGFSQEQATQVKVDSVTFNVSSGLNILLNTVLVKGLFINSSFVGTQGINFYGSFPGRLRLQECFIYNSGATGTGVVSNNSGSGSSLSLDNCILQSGAFGGIGLDHQQGYTTVRNDSEISRYQYPIQCAAGNLEILNAIIDNSGVANEVIRVSGGLVTVGYSTIKNTTTNASGVNLTTAGASLGMGDATFAIGTGTGYCVTGVAGTFFLYGRITYSNSAAASYNVKVKNTITSLAVTQAFTSSP